MNWYSDVISVLLRLVVEWLATCSPLTTCQVILFLAALVVIGIDIFNEFQGGRDRVVVLFLLLTSLLMAVLALIGFIFLANQWSKTNTSGDVHPHPAISPQPTWCAFA